MALIYSSTVSFDKNVPSGRIGVNATSHPSSCPLNPSPKRSEPPNTVSIEPTSGS